MQPLATFCSLISDIPGTFISGVWFWISFSFSHYWYIIVPAIISWVVIEVFTMNSHSFNSDNGFSPLFNSFVGGGVFYILSALIHFILSFFIGKGVECGLLWINSFYLIPFVATSLLLNAVGFWKYWRIPILNIKIIDPFGKNSRW